MDNFVYIECKTCKKCCCSGVSDGVFSYSMIKAIINKEIPIKIINELVIYQVPIEKMDFYAKKWWHYPKSNILYNLTLKETNYFHFLAVPNSKNDCIFYSKNGCKYTVAKDLDCTLFPYHYYKGEFYMEQRCPITKTLTSDAYNEIKLKIWDLTEKYAQFCLIHQKSYFKNLKIIQKQYNFPIIMCK